MLNSATCCVRVRPRALAGRFKSATLLLTLALGTHACSAATTHPAAQPALAVPASTSVTALGPGDVFDIRVFEEQELSGTYRVLSDGSINFPLVGKAIVGGLTVSQLSELLERELSHYLRQPNVSIFVKEYNSRKVYVFGEVNKPGTFVYEEAMNVIQAITLAGGFTKLADKNGTSVTRVIDGREQRIPVHVRDIGEGNAPNFRLEPADIVFVPESIF